MSNGMGFSAKVEDLVESNAKYIAHLAEREGVDVSVMRQQQDAAKESLIATIEQNYETQPSTDILVGLTLAAGIADMLMMPSVIAGGANPEAIAGIVNAVMNTAGMLAEHLAGDEVRAKFDDIVAHMAPAPPPPLEEPEDEGFKYNDGYI